MEKADALNAIENILFAAGDAVALDDISTMLGVEPAELLEWVDEEILRRQAAGGLWIKKIDAKIQLCTNPDYSDYVRTVLGANKPEILTNPMLETLAIIAYKQPITRIDVENIRGVNSSYMISTLMDKDLICEAGRKETLGRPILYATTDNFLRHFGIENLSQLPTVLSEE